MKNVFIKSSKVIAITSQEYYLDPPNYDYIISVEDFQPVDIGDTYDIVLKLLEEGNPLPANDYNWRLVVTSEEFPTTTSSTLFELTGTGTSDGLISFPINSTQANLVGDYFFEVEGTHKVTSKVKTFVEGKIKFIQDKAK